MELPSESEDLTRCLQGLSIAAHIPLVGPVATALGMSEQQVSILMQHRVFDSKGVFFRGYFREAFRASAGNALNGAEIEKENIVSVIEKLLDVAKGSIECLPYLSSAMESIFIWLKNNSSEQIELSEGD